MNPSLYNFTARPQITIVMPVFNAGRYLRPALVSIIKQSFTDWELLLIDDGSTDGAVDALKDLLADSRIKLLRDGANKGLAKRLNEGIEAALGEFIARMDQDDIAYPERLARQIVALKADPLLDLLGVRYVSISMTDDALGMLPLVTNHAQICAAPWRGFYLAHPTWMGRTEWFRANPYAEPGPYFCEDQELLLRTYKTSTFACLPEALFAYRLRNSVPWKKAVRTRFTLLKLRLPHFLQGNDFVAALHALSNFIVGTCFDVLSQSRITSTFTRRYSTRIGQVPSDEVKRLQQVLSSCHEQR